MVGRMRGCGLLGAAFAFSVVFADGDHELTVAPGGMTPQEAQAKIRAAKAAGDAGGWTVRVKDGLYALEAPLVFLPGDSGTPDKPVRWIGEGGRCVFAGGAPIVGWKDEGGGVWSADLPRVADAHGDRSYVFFEQLWVNGRRADRARLPNRGWFSLRDPKCAESKELRYGGGKCFVETFRLEEKEADLLARVPADELAYAQLCLVCKWTFARRVLRGYDAATKTVVTHSPTAFPYYAGWGNGNPVWFENVRSAFDAPGEWFYDAKAGKVKYRPLLGEDMATAVVLAPTANLSQLVRMQGDPEKGAYVHDILFSGISFEGSDSKTILTDVVRDATGGKVVLPESGPTESWQYQAAQSADAAITCEGARNVVWDGCAVRHTANYGFRFNDGCVSNRIVNSTLEDLGAGGIWMGARKSNVPPGAGTALARRQYLGIGPKSTAFNVISNCVIRNAGRFNPEGTGVAITHASDCRVTSCTITNVLYTGVSVGWVWGFSGSVAQRNEIDHNLIADLGQGLMSDMGGVYTLGTSYGTRVHHNVVHDVKSFSYGGWALYTDEGSEGIVMDHNLCWNTTDGGFHQHFGSGCVIRNNIFAWNRMVGAVRTSRDVVQNIPCTLHFVNNIVVVKDGPLAAGDVFKVGGVWANNLWFDYSGRAQLGGRNWAGWVASGKEQNGRYTDPQFVDPEKFDFRLKDGSPAFALGFEAWDWSGVGADR